MSISEAQSAVYFEFAHELNDCQTATSLDRTCTEFATRLGFRFHQLESCFPPSAEVTVSGNFPVTWLEQYRTSSLAEVDPIVRVSRTQCAVVHWDRIDFAASRLGARERQVIAEARTAGLTAGISVPVHGAGAEHSVLSFAGRSDRGELVELIECGLHLVARRAHEASRRALEDQGTSLAVCDLTPRERDCLSWTAVGKTSWEIARILDVTESTIVFHLRNAIGKMGVSNRPQAVAKALMCSYISPQTWLRSKTAPGPAAKGRLRTVPKPGR